MGKHDDDDDEGADFRPGHFSSDYAAEDGEFDAQEDEPRRGPLVFVIALGVLLIISTVIWNAYRQGVREGGRDAPPRITAEGPAKVAPVNPGGEVVPGQDVAVYDEIDGGEPAEAKAPDVASPRAAAALKPPSAAQEPELATAPKPVSAAGGQAGPAVVPAAAGAIVFAKNGPYVAQIAALRSEAAADAQWTKVVRLAPDLFNGAQKDIQRADLGAKGVFYRLRAGSFATRDRADEFCGQVQAAGQGCIVAAR